MAANGTPNRTNGWFRSRSRLILLGFLAVAGFFLITEHTAHVFGVLPYVLVLACPLMHFLHGGHAGKYGDHDGPTPPTHGSPR